MLLVRPRCLASYTTTIVVQPILKKKGRKGDTVGAFHSSGLEMIFALLAKTAAILVLIASVEV